MRAYHHTYGLPVVTTNCSNNYGPYQFPEKLIPVIIESVCTRKSIPVYGDGMNVRDWLLRSRSRRSIVASAHARQRRRNIQYRRPQRMVEHPHRGIDLRPDGRVRAPHLGGTSRKLITFVKDRPGHDRRYAIDAGKIQRELRLDSSPTPSKPAFAKPFNGI